MATGRKRSSGNWEFTIKRKGLLPAPVYLTYDTEAEGLTATRKIEALLDRGIIPDDLKRDNNVHTIAHAIRDYQNTHALGASDVPLLDRFSKKYGDTRLQDVTYDWIEATITRMKREEKNSPTTIKHYIGAFSRCLDWCVNKQIAGMQHNPTRSLPNGYAQYSERDGAIAGVKKTNVERTRRLEEGEEAKIRTAIENSTEPEAGALMFTLAIETAMRMRETYTLTADQVDLERRTIFLNKTKNGDLRQVPLSSPAIAALQKARLTKKGRLLPWWDGKADSLTATTYNVSRFFAGIFAEAGCPDLHYHDLRHEATSRFYERTTLGDVEISRITGHKDLRMLRRYTNLRGSSLAIKLW